LISWQSENECVKYTVVCNKFNPMMWSCSNQKLVDGKIIICGEPCLVDYDICGTVLGKNEKRIVLFRHCSEKCKEEHLKLIKALRKGS
jgi:hypothetical protein